MAASLKSMLASYLKLLKEALADPTPERIEEVRKLEGLYRLGFVGEREDGDAELVAKLHDHIAIAREELDRRTHFLSG